MIVNYNDTQVRGVILRYLQDTSWRRSKRCLKSIFAIIPEQIQNREKPEDLKMHKFGRTKRFSQAKPVMKLKTNLNFKGCNR